MANSKKSEAANYFRYIPHDMTDASAYNDGFIS